MNASLSISLNSPEETSALASRLGGNLSRGDVLLLNGPIGSGKTHFARALIQSVLADPEDIPSPTFTLVQVYDTQIGEIWHSDLYRLTAIEEIEELGLTEAFETGICLIEWPEKLGPVRPESALTLAFRANPDDDDWRRLDFSWTDPKWARKLETAA
ncbi:tRNA (adenosine(37)-N6)-threonylcarbamoyltransferase complex ATPase subunit type 1 TsaE [Ruegeria sp.]|uniref:tRNA (adenosine(37)-N6)-threonylcarbamoyltransferase complex ATPase subunit type 1 TsaE n=1 Tax=Ruegeria sp. TaxID=1879320 RepID=UPI003C7AD7B7